MKRLFLIFSIFILSNSSNSKNIEYCDIKGYVNNPGVYEIKENYTIQDIINLAGGLKDKAYTDNINLSKKVIDEMVIYIFNENEIKEIESIMTCTCTPIYKYIECEEDKTTQPTIRVPIETNTTIETTTLTTTTTISTTTTKEITSTTNTSKININTCTIEDLIKLDGLGETKAKKIIEYREANGLFETIEDILKINGIGDSLFEKIKEYIQV